MDSVILKQGREKPLKRLHPWIFSGAIAEVRGSPESGDTVIIFDSNGEFLAYGAYSPDSQIRVRVWTWVPGPFSPEVHILTMLAEAIDYRKQLSALKFFPEDHFGKSGVDQNSRFISQRLVHGESDRMPGLIVDQYDKTLVLQVLSAGPERWRETIIERLVKLTGIMDVYERSDVQVRNLEGLEFRTGPVNGSPPKQLVINEGGLKFEVLIESGHKTGFYLDQRMNRHRIRTLSSGKDVLDCFCYNGGFSVNALMGKAASVTSVDTSNEALKSARKNVKINNLDPNKVEWLEADVFQQLRKFRDQARSFDLIILDPPKFAPTLSHVNKAARGYKDINLLAFKLLRPGGILITFSCSGGLDKVLFQKVVADAALDAGVDVQIIEHLEQSPDHPVALNFPEGAYLKGLILHRNQ